MKVGDLFRYADERDVQSALVDGLPNFWHATRPPDGVRWPAVQLEAGISAVRPVAAVDGRRCPVVVIRSSPHKAGSEITPWHDIFDSDRGHIRYYGDNKVGSRTAAWASRGNKRLLEQRDLHLSPERAIRTASAPILFFRGARHEGRVKGQVEFHGFGVIETTELLTQGDMRSGQSFTNVAYDFAVLDLTREDDRFPWEWINARRDPGLTLADTHKLAPFAWREWVEHGSTRLPRLRRNVAASRVASVQEQMPSPGSADARMLEAVLSFYDGRKARFEALAAAIVAHLLGDSGGRVMAGWITPPSSDHGADFVARLDIGTGFSTTRLVVLGQAKCERSATSGRDIARTVARLQRGWIGAYVTTSYFSKAVQEEVLEDRFPILLIPGGRVAAELQRMLVDGGYTSIRELLEAVDATYDELRSPRRPEEILLDV